MNLKLNSRETSVENRHRYLVSVADSPTVYMYMYMHTFARMSIKPTCSFLLLWQVTK